MTKAKQSKVRKSGKTQKTFSLVPAAAQRQMYETIAAMKSSAFTEASGTEIAKVAVSIALDARDSVILCHAARGTRAVRKSVTKSATNASKRFSAATTAAVETLIADAKSSALVCAGRLQSADHYRGAFRFAAQHKLPILYLVANSLTAGRSQALDLRTLYAEFGIPVFSIDANDGIAAFRVATEALHNAHHGRGPCVIEALTFGQKSISKVEALELLQGYMERHDNWPI